MSFFPFLHFFNFIVYLYLTVYIFLKNPKSLLNRLCIAFLLCLGLWSFALIFVHNPYTSKNTAKLLADISSFGWASISAFFLWLIIAFTGKKKILKTKWFYLLLFVIPLVLIYRQWTNFLIIDFSKEYYGWKPIFRQSGWSYLFFLYIVTFMAAALYININFMRSTPKPILKKQAETITIFTLILLLLSGSTDIVLPLFGIYIIPDATTVFGLIWAFGLVYAMVKYKFLSITPVTAAGNIISTMFDALFLLNMKGEIEFVNKAGAALSGYRGEELKGVSLTTLFSEQDFKADQVNKAILTGSLENRDVVFKTKKGENVPVLFSSSLLRDEAGTAAGVVCVAMDVSGRKKLEEEVLKGKKLEAIGVLAGGIAHDFNNLLAAILGNIALVQKIIGDDKEKQELLKKAEEASLKAADLATRFITFSPGEWLYRKEIALSTILKYLSNSGLPGENIKYDIDIPADLPAVYADEEQLAQSLQNLLINAAEAMPEGGKISLSAGNVSVKPKSDLPVKAGDYVKVIIKDTGIGIPAENIEKIFDPYFSTKERMARKGTGLGLTACYSIIKKHGGYIAVESKVGQGTTVTLYLPVYSAESTV